ncbi:MAG: HAD hydrolase-like protein [Minisyncoccia bacterium]
MVKKFVLFDFDGVIANSFQVGFNVYKSVYPDLTIAEFREAFDGNIHDWKEAMAKRNAKKREGVDSISEYSARMKGAVHIVPGMREVIISLEKDYSLAVISSTLSHAISEFLAAHDLAGYFEWIMGSDVHWNKTQKIKMVFEKYGVTHDECIFITDTLGDIREARGADVDSIAVTWGFQTPDTLREGKPFRLVEAPNEIPVAVSDYFAQTI